MGLITLTWLLDTILSKQGNVNGKIKRCFSSIDMKKKPPQISKNQGMKKAAYNLSREMSFVAFEISTVVITR